MATLWIGVRHIDKLIENRDVVRRDFARLRVHEAVSCWLSHELSVEHRDLPRERGRLHAGAARRRDRHRHTEIPVSAREPSGDGLVERLGGWSPAAEVAVNGGE